ncbi:MAG: 4Fe-4S dicluster domain-containing protein [Clostridiales Family XIII bacterium]|jgi:Na+-translocating ferredoxin:NAD+ oxidoreductase RnfC subunit|nr:4Fe-4S dicluster domain-containing protein [Clostridiales Family XIII bacterium]
MIDAAGIRKAGVIGAGGAGFPTYAKLTSKADYVILNGAECEPLLRVDQQLMDVYAEDVIAGLEIARNLSGAAQALIGIKAKHKSAITRLNEAIDGAGLTGKIEVRIIKDAYPAGDEQILVYELTGRVVPETGIPIMVGCVVLNSETAINIARADRGENVTDKYLTVAGNVSKPITCKVAVGTPIKDVLRLAGIQDTAGLSVIDGGPMMGPVLENLDGYVTKKSKGYVVLDSEHPLIKKKTMSKESARRINKSACEQCRMCTDLCPRYLIGHNMQPHKIMRSVGYNFEDIDPSKTVYLCSQCSLCSLFSCPAGLNPKAANMAAKDELIARGEKYTADKEATYEARSARSYRQVSTKRLVKRLGLAGVDVKAPLLDGRSSEHLQATLCEIVGISLRPHVGAPAIPVVKQGDQVTRGQLIADVDSDKLGAAIHASVTGTVERVDESLIIIRRS